MNDRQIKLAVGCLLSDKRLPKADTGAELAAQILQAGQLAEMLNSTAENGSRDVCGTIFNVLNGSSQSMVYPAQTLTEKPVYPQKNAPADKQYMQSVSSEAEALVKSEGITETLVNKLLRLYEEKLAFVPGSAADIPLYDHLKLTAAVALCADKYSEGAAIPHDEKAFVIYSIDLSGIQSFIYDISSKGALKGLRARSFYLEMLFEVYIDLLLARLSLCRANVLYAGGGHAYFMLPNTAETLAAAEEMLRRLNSDLLGAFGSSLYAAAGWAACSANDLRNKPQGSYKQIFAAISEMIGMNKLSRYNAEDIVRLNAPRTTGDHSRECTVCHRFAKKYDNERCEICAALERLSGGILSPDTLFAAEDMDSPRDGLALPFGKKLTSVTENEAAGMIKADPAALIYTKNGKFTAGGIYRNIHLGNYVSQGDFAGLAANANGIKRLAVIRADVDNLGQSFVNGFSKTGGGRYETISRTSVFSRKLSEFFKYHINYLLRHGEYQLYDDTPKDSPRNAAVVYAGGDDLFIVGGWDDIIGFSIDLKNALKCFAQGTLTVSAGVGIYPEKYPISAMANETGSLESLSKSYNGGKKNAVTLFDESGSYGWEEFEEKVLNEKLAALKAFIANSSTRGKAMLYKMLELIRDKGENGRLNVARFAYLLARNCPDKDGEEKNAYIAFEQKMYKWIQTDKDRRQLVTAIYIYIYMNRGVEDDE